MGALEQLFERQRLLATLKVLRPQSARWGQAIFWSGAPVLRACSRQQLRLVGWSGAGFMLAMRFC